LTIRKVHVWPTRLSLLTSQTKTAARAKVAKEMVEEAEAVKATAKRAQGKVAAKEPRRMMTITRMGGPKRAPAVAPKGPIDARYVQSYRLNAKN